MGRLAVSRLARLLTAASVRRPGLTLAVALGLTVPLGLAAARLSSEVGYAAYFGPDDPAVERLADFFEEFESGLHVVVAFGCPGSRVCASFRERAALDLLGRLQRELDRLPNVRRTRSLLDAPIVVGPLETRTLAERDGIGSYALVAEWPSLLERALEEPFIRSVVVSADGRTAGVVVELQSLASREIRAAVHALLTTVSRYEAELGGEIFVAGDPVWTVLADDDLDPDSRNLTLLMFVLITAVLWAVFRDPWLTLLPVLSVGALTIATRGGIGCTG
jgi:predicted RND superfamily exporter protein